MLLFKEYSFKYRTYTKKLTANNSLSIINISIDINYNNISNNSNN